MGITAVTATGRLPSPTSEPSTRALVDAAAPASATLAGFIRSQAPLFVLTGAGCSTDSGIPDYRDQDGHWKRAEPIRYQRFVRDPDARRRYWARSFVGWPRVAAAQPNATHRALAGLEAMGLVTQLVTQNVDGLHQRGGARRVLDLHGRLDAVDCLDCGLRLSRECVQTLLAEHNPGCVPVAPEVSAPDGDVLLGNAAQSGFLVPDCPECGGMLKPAVVFLWRECAAPAGRACHGTTGTRRRTAGCGVIPDRILGLPFLRAGRGARPAHRVVESRAHPRRRSVAAEARCRLRADTGRSTAVARARIATTSR